MKRIIRICKPLLLSLLLAALAGCASTGRNPQDPYEGFNRTMFNFNDKLDKVALKPAATAYKTVTPSIVQTGVGNFFSNLHDIPTALNNALQARMADAASDTGRVLVNTVFGVVGTVDIASHIGLTKHDQDFGQTLGRWGVQSGPYVVLPLFGPSTVRDAFAQPVDFETNPWSHKYPVDWRNTGTAIRAVDARAYALDSASLLENAALDRYEFVRDAYLQHRQSEIYRPKPPDQDSGESNGTKQEVDNSDTTIDRPDEIEDTVTGEADRSQLIESIVRDDLIDCDLLWHLSRD